MRFLYTKFVANITYNKEHKIFARNLRRSQTDVEKLLWSKLRNRQIENNKFRRQHPLSNYILDFYCIEQKLAVELDGSQHTKPDQRLYDNKRTKVLNSLGIKVLRFWDNDVLNNLDEVLEIIRKNL